jgi:hypothetical protein
MNHSGDAAEQIVRMSLEGVEVAAKITGTAAKEIAAFLVAALKSNNKNSKLKLKGKARMTSMLKSGKALEIFSVKESDLQKFSQAAKQYGIVYCVLRNTRNSPDGLCDVMVKADDAPKISRIVERFQFATVDKAKIESEIVTERTERTVSVEVTDGAEPEAPDVDDTEKLLDDLLGVDEGKAEPDTPEPEKERTDGHPLAGGGEPPRSNPSEPTSESRKRSENRTLSKPSVKEELREITAAIKAKEADAPRRDERPAAEKPGRRLETTHKQPQRGKYKPKRIKENR